MVASIFDASGATAQHRNAIQALALETGAPEEEMAELYVSTLAELDASARVKSFLAILASRKVKELVFRKRRGNSPKGSPDQG